MQVGVTLPQFSEDIDGAVAVANEAERLGFDGVFVFDHLWSIGQPESPAIDAFALLGALAQETTAIRLGTLVARVGLVPDAVLVHQFETLARMIGPRLIAGVGTGDRISAAENLAYGIAYPHASERLASVDVVCRTLRGKDIETWVGGRSAAIRTIAAGVAHALNVWDTTPDEVAADRAIVPRVTWGGQVDMDALDAPAVTRHLTAIADAGADFAICAPVNAPWDVALETLAGARDLLH